jgi:RNA polymerase sigma factor (sigma-70 family)
MSGQAPQSFDTVQMNDWVDQYRKGDRSAADELFRAASKRLEHLARKMLRKFPTVSRWEETDDVLQNALVRLLRALGEIEPKSTRDFFGLAAEQIRRELLDLARRYQGPHGLGRRQTTSLKSPAESTMPGIEPADQNHGADDFDRWARLHDAVEGLPVVEREVFSLVFYHGMKQAEIGGLLGMDERTIRRRWASASSMLNDALGGDLPTE